MKRRTIGGLVVFTVLGVVLGSRLALYEAAIERAYRICGECGLEPDEIDRQIDNKIRSTLTREEEIELYHSTSKPGDDLAPCLPCVEAVLDAAEEEEKTLR